MRPKSRPLLFAVVLIASGGIVFLAWVARTHTLVDRGQATLPPTNATETSGRALEPPDAGALEAPRTALAEPEAPPQVVALAAPAAIELLGDESTWPAEYANRSNDFLSAEEKRLRAENEADLDAEIEKRFAQGQVETYRQGEQPTGRVVFGKQVGRGDATHYRIVEIDPRVEPQFWSKVRKANWLREELGRRR